MDIIRAFYLLQELINEAKLSATERSKYQQALQAISEIINNEQHGVE